MATWHITPKVNTPVVLNSRSIPQLVRAVHPPDALIKRYAALFSTMGFTVGVLPELQIGITVGHRQHSAMSLFMLKHDCSKISVVQVV
jgi:hypothetical protein